jgi:diacylglycerol kinase
MSTKLVGKKRREVRDIPLKARGFKRFVNSWKYSFAGLKYAYTQEQSLTIHAILTVIVVVSGIYFEISSLQWALVLFTMALIIVTELLNTAIEAVVDMVTEEYHPLAKVAKDCASAAVFFVSAMATGMWLYVFLPKIMDLIF